MKFEITTDIDEDKFIEKSEEVTHDDDQFSHEISEAIDNAVLKVSKEFSETQQLEFEDNVNSVLNSSEDSIEIKNFLQEITERSTYTDDENDLIKKIADVLAKAGDEADPFVRDDPMFKKAIINATFSMLGIGAFSENFKIAGKIILGGTAAYFVIKTILNNQNVIKTIHTSKAKTNIDYIGLFGDFSSEAKKIYEAFISFDKTNYFLNLSKLSDDNCPLSNKAVFLLDHAWLLGSSIYLFPLCEPYNIDKFYYYNKIHSLSKTLDNGLVSFYRALHNDSNIPLGVRLDIGRAAILVKLMLTLG